MDRVMEESRTLLHSQPGLMRTLMIGVCGVLLVLFVLRPLARQVTATLGEPLLCRLSRALVPACLLRRAGGSRIAQRQSSACTKFKAQQHHQGIFEHVSEHIRREPAQSTRLLEAWIGTPEEKSNGSRAQFQELKRCGRIR